jgi:ketosteroid isomerase-like protein
MLRFGSAVLALELVAGSTGASQTLTSVERAALADTIRAQADGFIAALSSLDFQQVMKLFTTDSDFSYVDQGHIYPTRDALAAAGSGFMKRTKRLTGRWESPRIVVLGRDAAGFMGTFRADGADLDGTPVWTTGKIWSFVYQRRRGEWRIVQVHESNAR